MPRHKTEGVIMLKRKMEGGEMLLMMLPLMRMTEPSGWATLELTNTVGQV